MANLPELILAGIVIAQQVFYMRQVQTLVDKLMSRDFHDYQRSVAPPPRRESVPEHPGIPEDLRVLQGFQIP